MIVRQDPSPIYIELTPEEASKLIGLVANIGSPDTFMLELYNRLSNLNVPIYRYEWRTKPCLAPNQK